MDRPYLHIDLHLESVSASADISLSPLADWWRALTDRNAEARALDGEPQAVLSVRIACPSCSARIPHLTLVTRGDSLVRVCRRCRHQFAVGG